MLIIGITGGTGSGKTTVVEQVVAGVPKGQICVISQDSYYRDTSHLSYADRTKINFDHPHSIDFELMASHLKELRNGKTIEQPVYSFKEHNRTDKTITTFPKKVLIIEGILISANQVIRDLFDINVYVDADNDERLIRRLKRDINERGRDLREVLERYQNTLKPMHQEFIAPTKKFADIIIPTNTFNPVAVNLIRNIINQTLA